MEEFEEDQPMIIATSSSRYPRLAVRLLPDTPTALCTYKKAPRNRLIFSVNDHSMFEIPLYRSCFPRSMFFDCRPYLQFSDKLIIYLNEDKMRSPLKFDDIVDSLSGDVQTMAISRPVFKKRDLDKAISTKSTLVYMPIDIKLTDKHLALMPTASGSPEEIVWPYRWQFDEILGSFLCVVQRLDKNIYEFKVLLVPGAYTDDPVTLAMLVKLFNPLYQNVEYTREAVLDKAKMMVASSANEFFGPQIVDSCIAVWLSGRRDRNVIIKKSNVILKMNNVKLMAANARKKKILKARLQADPTLIYND